MENINSKPKLLFFQFRYDENVPYFLLIHKQEHVQCLELFFEVILINEDADYRELCEIHEPDLALFETGLQLASAHRLNITNTHAYPDIPKLGFFNADSWANTREGILSDMDHWGIETYFSICVTAPEHTPEVAQNLFVWPNFINPRVFKDHGNPKVIPVLLTGCQDPQYTWRDKIFKVVSKVYPTLTCPHHGYFSRAGIGQFLDGEKYARALNSSWLAPTCGTVAKEVVRKHLEIPGSMTCLISEESPGLKAAGFVDMKNCVFADEHDVLDKIEYLFQNPAELNEIIRAGHQLVHTRHTAEQRDQIFQWFSLNKELKAGQKIVQVNPYEPFQVIPSAEREKPYYIVSNGLHLDLYRQADKFFLQGNYPEAEALYLKSIKYIGGSMSEPKLKLALCYLYHGKPKAALNLMIEPIRVTISRYHAVDPDPVQWAYFIICLVCLGKIKQAWKRARQFPAMSHPELDRARAVVDVLISQGAYVPSVNHGKKPRRSIHALPNRSFEEWIQELCVMLNACGQDEAEKTLRRSIIEADSFPPQPNNRTSLNGREAGKAKPVSLHFLDNPLLISRTCEKTKSYMYSVMNQLESGLGYFLPFSMSAKRKDQFYSIAYKIGSKISTGLLLGAIDWKGSAEAFLAGVQENEKRPPVHCIMACDPKQKNGSTPSYATRSIRTHFVYANRKSHPMDEMKNAIEKIMNGIKINAFDAVLVDMSQLDQEIVIKPSLNYFLSNSIFVLIHNINNYHNHNLYIWLLRSPHHALITFDLGMHNGYAVFERRQFPSI